MGTGDRAMGGGGAGPMGIFGGAATAGGTDLVPPGGGGPGAAGGGGDAAPMGGGGAAPMDETRDGPTGSTGGAAPTGETGGGTDSGGAGSIGGTDNGDAAKMAGGGAGAIGGGYGGGYGAAMDGGYGGGGSGGGAMAAPAHRVTRALHDEHMAVIALLRRFAAALDGLDGADGADGATPAGPEEPRLAGLFAELAGAIEGEVSGHFAFEEEALFPLLEAAGEGGLGQMLTEEHREILPLGQSVAALARQFTSAGLDPRDRAEFRRTGRDFAALLSAHAEKEEMALLPLLDEILEPEDDARLAAAYLDGATGGAGPMDEVGGAGGPGATEAGR